MDDVVVRKRVVLLHHTGPLAGLFRIVGLLEGPAADVSRAILPTFGFGNPRREAQHAKTTSRYVLYREWAQAPTGSLNDLNPAQV